MNRARRFAAAALAALTVPACTAADSPTAFAQRLQKAIAAQDADAFTAEFEGYATSEGQAQWAALYLLRKCHEAGCTVTTGPVPPEAIEKMKKGDPDEEPTAAPEGFVFLTGKKDGFVDEGRARLREVRNCLQDRRHAADRGPAGEAQGHDGTGRHGGEPREGPRGRSGLETEGDAPAGRRRGDRPGVPGRAEADGRRHPSEGRGRRGQGERLSAGGSTRTTTASRCPPRRASSSCAPRRRAPSWTRACWAAT